MSVDCRYITFMSKLRLTNTRRQLLARTLSDFAKVIFALAIIQLLVSGKPINLIPLGLWFVVLAVFLLVAYIMEPPDGEEM